MSEPRKRRAKVEPLRASEYANVGKAAPPAASAPTAGKPGPAPGGVPKSKFTASLDFETAESFDRLAMVARRKLMRQVDKLDVLSALITLAADDATLRDQVIDLIGERKKAR